MSAETAGPRRVKDVMTPAPACCVPSTPLPEVAMLFAQYDCGSIPVVENKDTGRPVGVVTDRDVVCRAVAAGRNPAELRALDCMTAPCITVAEDMSLEDCVALMEGNRIRRIVVVNDSGAVCGIVAQADIARRADGGRVAEVVRTISEPALAASQVEPSVAE
ncbi:MAG TPA: CBS domain-containing protein [Thermoanaerobaculia bacterium]|nr:CBS domain-containing protein [Thermoanaerobaculia bacterium]